jgi:hypothetical protein
MREVAPLNGFRFVGIWCLILVLASLLASCTPFRKTEEESVVQDWFDKAFAKCGTDHFARYDNEYAEIYLNKYGSSATKTLIEFKNLTYKLERRTVTSTEQLNGVQSKSEVVLKYTQFRYHDGTKWSPWEDIPIVFKGEMMKALNDLLERPNSPLYLGPEKSKGQWSGFPTYWTKMPCAEIPGIE